MAFLDAFETDPSVAAWVTSAPPAIMLIGSLVTGPLSVTCGPRVLAMVGALLAGTGMALTSLADTIGAAGLLFALMGLGFALSFTPAIVVVPMWFEKQKALAMGIAGAGAGVGTFAMAPVANALIVGFGWRQALLILGCSVGGLMFVAALLFALPTIPYGSDVHPDVSGPSIPSAPSTSSIAGLVSSTGVEVELSEARCKLAPKLAEESETDVASPPAAAISGASLSPAAVAGPLKSTAAGDEETASSRRLGVCELLAGRRFLCLFLGIAVMTGGYNAVFSHLVNSNQLAGASPNESALAISVLGVSSTISGVIVGRIADSGLLRSEHLWYGAILVGGLATTLVSVLEQSSAGRFLYAGVFGLCGGAIVSLVPVAAGDAVHARDVPLGVGMLNSVQTLPVLFAPPIAGAIAVSGGYQYAWLFMGMLMLGGSSMALFHPVRTKPAASTAQSV